MRKPLDPYNDPYNYILPDAIPKLIAVIQKKVAEEIAGINDPLAIAEIFRSYHKRFCTVSRHSINDKANEPVPDDVDPQPLSPEDRRVNFHTMIKSLAA
ncbi:MAG TPA: hypothetical protein VFR09_06310, partial [Alphaproteobacteria bacterium]|nr:hypothetical protein [Alphaproteobacteria bacterium]